MISQEVSKLSHKNLTITKTNHNQKQDQDQQDQKEATICSLRIMIH